MIVIFNKKIYMKRIQLNNIIGAIMLMIVFTSCGEDFLKIEHWDITTPDVYTLSQANLEMGLTGIYRLLIREGSNDLDQNWNLKPQIAFSNYPANDLQPDGWDREFAQHTWKSDFYMFGDAWLRAYRTIDRINNFLENLEKIDPEMLDDKKTKDLMSAEARALRAWFYTFLCQSWGSVPMLRTGETYSNSPGKKRDSTEEAWALIIEDYIYARDILDWTPRKGELGRVTKGMVKAYLGVAYMYQKDWNNAKKELLEVINSGQYELNPCFGYIHSYDKIWQKESVWEIAYKQWPNMGWGAETTYNDAMWYGAQMFAAGEWGGWGPSHTSFEFVWSFEPGDRRLEYSVAQFGDLNEGYYTKKLGMVGSAQVGMSHATAQPFVGNDILPNNYNKKFWKRQPTGPWHAIPVTYMRLAGVMLNYAECCFETGDMATGWAQIQTIRNRAWGKLEAGATKERHGPTYDPTATDYATANTGDFTTWVGSMDIDLNTNSSIEAPDAEPYYSTYKRIAGTNGGYVNAFKGWMPNKAGTDSLFSTPRSTNAAQQTKRAGYYEREWYDTNIPYAPYTSPVWKVALMMERRHEFFGEYSFWQDLCRMGMAKEYLEAEYPLNATNHPSLSFTSTDNNERTQQLVNFAQQLKANKSIQTYRPYPFDPNKMLFPIPQSEMDGNPSLTKEDQNPGY